MLIDNGDVFPERPNPHDASNMMENYLRTLPHSIAADYLDDLLDALKQPDKMVAMQDVLRRCRLSTSR